MIRDEPLNGALVVCARTYRMERTMKSIIREMFGELSAWGKFWLYIGLATLIAAAAMSWSFGSEVSVKHAVFLALLSVITAFAPETAYRMWKRGDKGVALTICAVCTPLFLIEFYSHAGYTAGLRGENISTARVQNASYTDARSAIDEDKDALAKAKADLDRLRSANPWAATVTADALRAQIPAIDEAIKQEAARVKCGSKCLALKEKKAKIESQIAIAEESNGFALRISELEKRLADRRDTGKKTAFVQSAVVEQNLFLAKAVALVRDGSLQPDAKLQEGAQQSVNLAMAIAGTGLPAFALFLAGLYRREEDEHDALPRSEAREAFMDTVRRIAADRGASMPKAIAA